jgi:hypothetical protein
MREPLIMLQDRHQQLNNSKLTACSVIRSLLPAVITRGAAPRAQCSTMCSMMTCSVLTRGAAEHAAASYLRQGSFHAPSSQSPARPYAQQLTRDMIAAHCGWQPNSIHTPTALLSHFQLSTQPRAISWCRHSPRLPLQYRFGDSRK